MHWIIGASHLIHALSGLLSEATLGCPHKRVALESAAIEHFDIVRRSQVAHLRALAPAAIQRQSEKYWREFWSRSAVEFQDQQLERIWYHNQYFLACCPRQAKVAPRLFGNWTSGKIGTSWHGDYHTNDRVR